MTACVRTGGAVAKYFGHRASGEITGSIRVTVNLRAVDIRPADFLKKRHSKTILSQQVQAGVFRFVEYKCLLEAEAALGTNEPGYRCASASAIELAVIRAHCQRGARQPWQLADARDMENPILQGYLQRQRPHL